MFGIVSRSTQQIIITLAFICLPLINTQQLYSSHNRQLTDIFNKPFDIVPARQLPEILNQTDDLLSSHGQSIFSSESENTFLSEKLIVNCGGTFKSQQTVVTTPNYPNNYPSSVQCEYVFKSPYVCPTQYRVQFLDFELELSQNCSKDRLKVEYSEVLCGQVSGIKAYNATNGVFRMVFESDFSVEYKGFRLLVSRTSCSDPVEPPASSGDSERSHPARLYPAKAEDINSLLKGVTTGVENAYNKGQQYISPTFNYLPSPNSNFDHRTVHPLKPVANLLGTITGTVEDVYNSSKQYLPPSNGFLPSYDPTYNPMKFPSQFPFFRPADTPHYPIYLCFPKLGEIFPMQFPMPNIFANLPQLPSLLPPMLPTFPILPSQNPSPDLNILNGRFPLLPPLNSPELYPVNQQPSNNFPQFPRLPKVETQISPLLPGTIPSCCARSFVEKRFYLSSHHFPGVNFRPTDCLFYIEKSGPTTCRLRLELKFFNVGIANPQGCFEDFLEIDGQRICGCKIGLIYISQWGLGAKVLHVKSTGRHDARFLLEIIQEDCPYRYLGNAEIEKRIDRPITAAIVETNFTTRSSYSYKQNEEEESPVYHEQFEEDSRTEGPSSQFLFNGFNTNSCRFQVSDWLRISVNPLWIARPRCV